MLGDVGVVGEVGVSMITLVFTLTLTLGLSALTASCSNVVTRVCKRDMSPLSRFCVTSYSATNSDKSVNLKNMSQFTNFWNLLSDFSYFVHFCPRLSILFKLKK